MQRDVKSRDGCGSLRGRCAPSTSSVTVASSILWYVQRNREIFSHTSVAQLLGLYGVFKWWDVGLCTVCFDVG